MSKFSKGAAIVVSVSLLIAISLLYAYPGSTAEETAEDFTAPFFRKLKVERANRKAQVVAYFEASRRLAEHIVEDPVMADAFMALRSQDDPPDPHYDLALDVHYVRKYGEFYDILLVDRSGYVFHTMRRESDYHSNLFEGQLADSKLARQLPTVRQIAFIDYERYPPSDEPAAFFVVPMHDPDLSSGAIPDGEPAGWFILQCPLNKLNSILSDRRGLGRTGEVYLVNTEQRMVTESRFRKSAADLQLKVETAAVASALESGSGERVIRDYRDVRVLSSFECFELLGTLWIVIAEIDENEAITEHYKQRRESYLPRLADPLDGTLARSRGTSDRDEEFKRVDINEFSSADAGTVLRTGGVSTCTAITAVLPGRLGYLAHVGPSDRIYGKPDFGYNDCLGEMLYRLRHYDVYPHELPKLEFTIIAVHRESYAAAIDRLLGLGVELSQIRFAYNPKAQYANVVLASSEPSVLIEWVSPRDEVTSTIAADVEGLGSIVKRLATAGNRWTQGRSPQS